jgi:DNA mismatch endonuclease (patch repair protein)
MSSVRSINTKPELFIRKNLYARGFRYTINNRTLPGKPDIVLKKYNAVIFVNGCFWHQHGCPKSKLPNSNYLFWNEKLSRNKDRDKKNIEKLINLKWRVCIIWVCNIPNKSSGKEELFINNIIYFITSNKNFVQSESFTYETRTE